MGHFHVSISTKASEIGINNVKLVLQKNIVLKANYNISLMKISILTNKKEKKSAYNNVEIYFLYLNHT